MAATMKVMKKAMKRPGAQPRKCGFCGKAGHTLRSCPLPGAAKLRELIQLVGHRTRQRGREMLKNHERTRKSKRDPQYTVQPTYRRTLVRRGGVASLKKKGVASMISLSQAYERLTKAKYLFRPRRCPDCHGKLTGPHAFKQSMVLRCSAFACHRRWSVLEGSPFKGSRLNLAQLWTVVDAYTNNDSLKKCSTDRICSKAEAGRWAVLSVTQTLSRLLVAEAKRENKQGSVGGDVEVDGHTVRSMCVSKTNLKFKHLHPKESCRTKRANRLRRAKYYLLHIRVLGLRKRGSGKVFMAFGDDILVPPRSRPPPENLDEVLKSDLFKRVQNKATVHFDGAQAWPAAIRKKYRYKQFKLRHVSHSRMEFVKKCRRVRNVNGRLGASKTGTQMIDATWGSLSKFINHGIHTKKQKQVNPALYESMWEWLWWVNRVNVNGFDVCGDVVAKWRKRNAA